MPEAEESHSGDALTDSQDGGHCIELPRSISVKQLAELLGASAIEVIKQLMRNGVMASINQAIDYQAAAAVAAGFGDRKSVV